MCDSNTVVERSAQATGDKATGDTPDKATRTHIFPLTFDFIDSVAVSMALLMRSRKSASSGELAVSAPLKPLLVFQCIHTVGAYGRDGRTRDSGGPAIHRRASVLEQLLRLSDQSLEFFRFVHGCRQSFERDHTVVELLP